MDKKSLHMRVSISHTVCHLLIWRERQHLLGVKRVHFWNASETKCLNDHFNIFPFLHDIVSLGLRVWRLSNYCSWTPFLSSAVSLTVKFSYLLWVKPKACRWWWRCKASETVLCKASEIVFCKASEIVFCKASKLYFVKLQKLYFVDLQNCILWSFRNCIL